MMIFQVFNLLFLQVLAFNKPKLCVNCKFFITDNDTGEFGKCALFPREDSNIYRLVNGNGIENIDYYYCSTSRGTEDMCGKEGKMHKRKYIKKGV